MNFIVNLKPRIIKDYSKESVLSKIRGCQTFGTYGHYLFDFDHKEESAIVYNLVKQNKKSKQTKNKDGKTIKSNVIKHKEWTAYVYSIPIKLLELTNSEVNQRKNNFIISKK